MTRHERHAFTILELSVVLAIIVVIAGVGIARAGSAGTQYRAELAARRLANDLEEASRQSLYRSTTITLTFDKINNLYTITGLHADGEVITVDLGSEPYRLDVTTFEVSGGNVLTYTGGVPSSTLPVSFVVVAETQVYALAVTSIANDAATDAVTAAATAVAPSAAAAPAAAAAAAAKLVQ